MHPHTATSAILRRGLTIRDLQCPPADADTVTSITIDDTIRAAKGNFGFVYAATGDRELYRECLLAESYAKTQYVSCAIHLRRAFELLAFYTVGRALCTVTPGLTMPEAKAHAKQFYESDPRCFNPKLQLSLVLAGLGYIDVVFNERFVFSDNPAYPGCKKDGGHALLAVQRRVWHGPHRQGWRPPGLQLASAPILHGGGNATASRCACSGLFPRHG